MLLPVLPDKTAPPLILFPKSYKTRKKILEILILAQMKEK